MVSRALNVMIRAAAGGALLSLGVSLSGCAGLGDTLTTGFADPAKYELYNCKQLETERKRLAERAAELKGLMAKADTGIAGPVVAEVAYRNEYISVLGQTHYAEAAWRKSSCHDTLPGVSEPSENPAKPGSAIH